MPDHPRLLPEWHRQIAILLSWPHVHSDWAAQLAQTEAVYLSLVQAITHFQKVVIICYDAKHQTDVRQRLCASTAIMDRILFVQAASNDTWVRDYGPLTVGNSLLDFRFNGWGGKYPHDRDDRISQSLRHAGVFGDAPFRRLEYVLEGGAIETDGAGTLLTTSRCLLSPTRNPGIDRNAMAQLLGETLGAERILWLEHGALEGDDTDGHVDMLARFADENTIVYTACDEPGYASHDSLLRMAAELREFRTKTGRPYRLVALPWPGPKFDDQGARLPASYANFLIINGAVLAPVYDDPADHEALRILQICFPRREIIGIPCLPLIRQYGSLHCATLQIPDTIPVKLT
ncbi:MAG: agmatine deiminase [Gammaproteobacteria bacterium]|nr:MAG: agmatine deiminase [Gammaproteobacteria bacterium]